MTHPQSTVKSTIRWGEIALQPFGSFATKPTTALNDPLLTPGSQASEIRLGTQISRDFSTDWGRLTPYASLNAQQESQSDWVGDFKQTDSHYNLGLGFEAAFSQQAKAFMSYETSLSADNDQADHRVYAGWLFNF